MVSLGMGLGAFAQGMGQGMQAAQQVKGVLRDKKVQRLERDATAAGTAARESDIAVAIQTTANPDGSQSYAVGGQQYADAGQAKNAASQQVGSVMDYYRTKTVPKLIEGYVQMGDPAKAQALQSWMETEDAGALTKDWARAARMALLGDSKAAMRGFGKLYEKLEPGSKYVGMEDLSEPIYEDQTDKDGKVTGQKQVGTRPTGVRLKLKSAEGEEIGHDFKGTEDLFQTAMLTLSPDKFVGRAFAEVDKAQASRAAAAKDQREFKQDVQMKKFDATLGDQRDQRQHERSIIRDDRQFGQQTARDDRQFTQQTQRDASQHGYRLDETATDIQLRAAAKLSEVSGEKPEDVRKSIETIIKRRSDTDMAFGKLSADEQVQWAVGALTQQRSAAKGVLNQGAAPAAKGIPKLW